MDANDKKPGYIPVGAAITSYARNFTIRHAQENFKHFIYADTDSIHCDCSSRYLKNIAVHPTAFNHWKIENEWDKAVFVRAKTYIEHTVIQDGEKCDPFYLIKCAGMGSGAKKKTDEKIDPWKYLKKLEKEKDEMTKDTYEERKAYLEELTHHPMRISDFTYGYKVDGNLKAMQIPGGTILVNREYKIA